MFKDLKVRELFDQPREIYRYRAVMRKLRLTTREMVDIEMLPEFAELFLKQVSGKYSYIL